MSNPAQFLTYMSSFKSFIVKAPTLSSHNIANVQEYSYLGFFSPVSEVLALHCPTIYSVKVVSIRLN